MDSGAGLQVIDVSNPANPQRTGGFGPTAGARGVAVAGNFVYVADSAGLLILYHATQLHFELIGCSHNLSSVCARSSASLGPEVRLAASYHLLIRSRIL